MFPAEPASDMDHVGIADVGQILGPSPSGCERHRHSVSNGTLGDRGVGGVREAMVEEDRSHVPSGLIVGIDHVGIAVADLADAIAFYADSFGFSVVHQEVNENQGVRAQ